MAFCVGFLWLVVNIFLIWACVFQQAAGYSHVCLQLLLLRLQANGF